MSIEHYYLLTSPLSYVWHAQMSAGGGGFLFQENFRPFIPRLHFFFLIVEISSRTLISLFMPGSVHSGSVSWDHCGRMFPDKLHVSSFLESSHTLPGQWHRHPTLTLNTCPKSDTCLLHTITSPFVIRVTYISIARYYPLFFILATCMSTERYWPFLCHMCDMHVCWVPLWSLKQSEDPTLLSQVHWLEQCVLVS